MKDNKYYIDLQTSNYSSSQKKNEKNPVSFENIIEQK